MSLRQMETEIVPQVLFMGYINYKTPWIHFPRLINEHVLYIMHEGDMFIEEGNEKFHLKKGEYLLLDPNIPHRGYKKSCCDYYYIHFKHPGITTVPPENEHDVIQAMILQLNQSLLFNQLNDFDKELADSKCYFRKHATLLNINEYMLTLGKTVDNFYHRNAHYRRSASFMLAELLIDIARENAYVHSGLIEDKAYNPSKSFIKAQNVLRFINSNYVCKITSKDIEEKLDSSFDYLNRIFRKVTGYTIFNYINRVRISRSKELMETTSLSLAEISYLVGIDDPFYFSKLFKKFSGICPSQYSKMVNNLGEKNL